jgi:hypothetical protein
MRSADNCTVIHVRVGKQNALDRAWVNIFPTGDDEVGASSVHDDPAFCVEGSPIFGLEFAIRGDRA